jgi:hypothetical protein
MQAHFTLAGPVSEVTVHAEAQWDFPRKRAHAASPVVACSGSYYLEKWDMSLLP